MAFAQAPHRSIPVSSRLLLGRGTLRLWCGFMTMAGYDPVSCAAVVSARQAFESYALAQLRDPAQARYAAALAEFRDWCQSHCPAFQSLSFADKDYVLAWHCLEDIFEEQGPGGLAPASDLVAAMQKLHPHDRFRVAFKLLALRRKEIPAVQACPLPADHLWALVSVLLIFRRPDIAWHCFLCFSALLRIGESLTLQVQNFVFDGKTMVIMLPRSKRGFDERIVVCEPNALALAALLLPHVAKDTGVMVPVTYNMFRRHFLHGLAVLGADPAGGVWRTHSLRRGGATALVDAGLPYSEIQLYGRWASERSCRDYVRRGASALVRLHANRDPKLSKKITLLSQLVFPIAQDL